MSHKIVHRLSTSQSVTADDDTKVDTPAARDGSIVCEHSIYTTTEEYFRPVAMATGGEPYRKVTQSKPVGRVGHCTTRTYCTEQRIVRETPYFTISVYDENGNPEVSTTIKCVTHVQ
jgi:hypothetical protein